MAVSYVASPVNTTGNNDININTVTIPTGATLAMICIGGNDGANDLASSVSLDSQSATLIKRQKNTDDMTAELWAVRGFATGVNKNLTIDMTGAMDYGCHVSIVFFSGEDSSTPTADPRSRLAPGSMAFTTTAGDMVIACAVAYGGDSNKPDFSTGTRIVYLSAYSQTLQTVAYLAASGTSTTMTYTCAAGSYDVAVGCVIKQVAAAGSGNPWNYYAQCS